MGPTQSFNASSIVNRYSAALILATTSISLPGFELFHDCRTLKHPFLAEQTQEELGQRRQPRFDPQDVDDAEPLRLPLHRSHRKSGALPPGSPDRDVRPRAGSTSGLHEADGGQAGPPGVRAGQLVEENPTW